MALAGTIEVLTPRRATGWVHDDEAPLAALKLRARDGDTLILESVLLAQAPASVGGRPGEFGLDFPSFLKVDSLARLSIEAAHAQSEHWYALPRYPRLWFKPESSTALPGEDWRRPSSNEPQTQARPRTYWSEAATEESVDWAESRPVFVLGPVRSGTTAMCLALEKGTRYKGFPEGHVLDVAIRLVNAINLHFEKKETIAVRDVAAYHLGNTRSSRFIKETVELVRRLGSGYTTPFWFDKTPTYPMVGSVPIVAEAWPNAKFIFMKRRGLESMRSRLRKFSKVDFRASCTDWALIMGGWRNVRKTVEDRYIEVDQWELNSHSQAVGDRVGAHLGLEAAEVDGFVDVLMNERPEATGSETIPAEVSGLGWTEEQVNIFREVCGKEMEAYGYTYDERYRA